MKNIPIQNVLLLGNIEEFVHFRNAFVKKGGDDKFSIHIKANHSCGRSVGRANTC